MRKEILLPAAALAGGGAGFVLRRTQLSAAYDPITRLMSADHPAAWALALLALVLLAAFVLACRDAGKKDHTPAQWFCAPGDVLYMMLTVSGALLLIAAACAGMWELTIEGRQNIMLTLSCGLSVVGAAGALAAGRSCYRKQWSDYVPLQLMGPAFCGLTWLVVCYQDRAREPEVQLFVWQILAGVAVVLALYCAVSLAMGKGGVRPVCLFGLMGVFLSMVTLADGHGLAYTLVCLFAVLFLTAQNYMLLRSAYGPPWPEQMPRRAEEDDDDYDKENHIRPLFGPRE